MNSYWMVQWTLQHPGVRVPDGSGPSYRIRTVKFPSQAATAMAVAMGESHQYGPAILGIAGTGDCRDQPAPRDGIYGHELFRRCMRVWPGITGIGVGKLVLVLLLVLVLDLWNSGRIAGIGILHHPGNRKYRTRCTLT